MFPERANAKPSEGRWPWSTPVTYLAAEAERVINNYDNEKPCLCCALAGLDNVPVTTADEGRLLLHRLWHWHCLASGFLRFATEMVGVPRSLGCQLCVKRRVKCDQTRPACSRCTKYGATCPGYERPLKFVAGKHQLRPRRQEDYTSPVPLSGPSTVSGTDDKSVLSGSNNSRPYTTEAFTVRPLARYVAQHQGQPSIPVPLSGDRGQIVLAYLNTVNHTQTYRDLQVFDPWFKDVPQYLGHNPVLDNAMAAFSLHILGKSNDDKSLIHHSRTIYGQSLVALQRALRDPAEWRSSETLCATMTLCLFEVGRKLCQQAFGTFLCSRLTQTVLHKKLFAGTTNANSWMKHAAGVSWLMQQRGPDAHKDPWDCNMLRSFRAITVSLLYCPDLTLYTFVTPLPPNRNDVSIT